MKTIVALAAIASVACTAAAQTGPATQLTAQDLLDIRQLIDGYSHVLDNCTNNGNSCAVPAAATDTDRVEDMPPRRLEDE